MEALLVFAAIFVAGYVVGYGHRAMISAYRKRRSRYSVARQLRRPVSR